MPRLARSSVPGDLISLHDTDPRDALSVDDPDGLLSGPAHRASVAHGTDLEHGSRQRSSNMYHPWNAFFGLFCRKQMRGAIRLEEQPPLFEEKRGRSRSVRFWKRLVLLSSMPILAAILCFFLYPWIDTEDPLAKGLRIGLYGEDVVDNPAEVTRGVRPLPCHSHNDYWRQVPLYEAIRYGCTGVEADVWLFDEDDELYVGHRTRSLTSGRNFTSLYVDPLVDILDRLNPTESSSRRLWNGIFQENPEQTLVLLVDFKTDGPTLWPHVMQQLEPLRSRNHLTYFDGDKTVEGPITVVATGHAPFDMLISNTTYRDVFFDAPLSQLSGHSFGAFPQRDLMSFVPWVIANILGLKTKQGTPGSTVMTTHTFNASNSYYASTSFTESFGYPWLGRLTDVQVHMLRQEIQTAQRHGLKARYWSTPSWPTSWRHRVWETLIKEGADFFNVDDLQAAAKMDWTDIVD